jgi:hypothetical protein
LYKHYVKKIFHLFWISIAVLFLLNYFIDPYGYQKRDGKFIKNLSMFNKPNVTNARINSDGYYYLIGSSRMARVDPNIIEAYSKKETHNIKLDGATLKENTFIASKVKENGRFFIYSFDAFSNNISRQKNHEINIRHAAYVNELKNFDFILRYFNSDITIRSIQHLLKKINGEKIYKQYLEQNSLYSSFSFDHALNSTGVLNNNDKSNFLNYESYPLKDIAHLAKLGKKNDIFIIFPKYFVFYSLFAEYQEIEKKYFSAIRELVHQTDAQVWSFYGVNDITIEKSNFIDNGWHFKPQVSNIMFDQIFNYKEKDKFNKVGILLTKDNVDFYLDNMSEEILKIVKSN